MAQDPRVRPVADVLGRVHKRLGQRDPRLVGTRLAIGDSKGPVTVFFLLPTERDVARAADGDLLGRLEEALAAELQAHGASIAPGEDLRIVISSLEGQGIPDPRENPQAGD